MSGPLMELDEDEMLECRVVTAELAELWQRRERIRSEQPTAAGLDGEEIFAEDADELAVRRFQRTDEQIAQLVLSNQGLVIRALVASVEPEL